MKHRDLGQLDGAVLLFGGPYSNLQALETVLGQADDLGIDADHRICTGDVVAYCGSPKEVVALSRAAEFAVAAGNCEIQLGLGESDCGCGFEEGSACDLLSIGWFGFANAVLEEEDRAWMASLPNVLSFFHQGERYAVIHGGVTDVARFIWPSSSEKVFEEEWQQLEAFIGPVDHIIAGHSGISFVQETSRGRWINAGVIGMPPNDGQQATRFGVLEGGAVRIEALNYDAASAARTMKQAGLPAGYREGLLSGYWPSEDVLPSDLRRGASANG